MDAAATRRNSPRLPLLAVVVALTVAHAGHAAEDRLAVAPTLDDGPSRPVERRLYLTGMLGSSVGTSSGDPAVPLVAGQGACGVAVPRGSGDLRLEFEARRRQPLGGAAGGRAGPAGAGDWTTMANVWRDLPITGNLGAYAGGGVGVGLRGPAEASRSGLGWQAGAGATYAATDRVTLDVGYRFSGIEAAGPRASPANELVFAVRIHEPFRGRRHDAGRPAR